MELIFLTGVSSGTWTTILQRDLISYLFFSLGEADNKRAEAEAGNKRAEAEEENKRAEAEIDTGAASIDGEL